MKDKMIQHASTLSKQCTMYNCYMLCKKRYLTNVYFPILFIYKSSENYQYNMAI